MRITLSKALHAARVVVLLAASAAALNLPASAAETSVTVKADQARIVPVKGEPATVVIGNPLFAEVTVSEGMILIHGRQFGTTNVLVLDNAGNTLSEFELNVVRGGSRNVTVYKGGSSYSYLCAPSCESTLQVGDNTEYFGAVNSAISTKNGLATGASKSSE
ncbi:MAG: pilus assembly protein N-terminal domain-containing protein [Parvibaculaceae bacterium]